MNGFLFVILVYNLLSIFLSLQALSIRLSWITDKLTLTNIPQRGFGLVASTYISKGELLIRETPIISVTTKQSWLKPSDAYSAARVDSLYQNLSAEDQLSFHSLHNAYSNNNKNNQSATQSSFHLLGVFRTNAYPTGNSSAGLFACISRLNSDCAPNVHLDYSEIDGVGVASIHSIADIQQGEEALNCYMCPLGPREERQTYFRNHFGFNCNCKVCRKSDDDLRMDDELRSRLWDLQTKTASLGMQAVVERLSLIRQLDVHKEELLMKCYLDAVDLLLSDRSEDSQKQLQHWLLMALRSAEICKGVQSNTVTRLRSLLLSK